MSAAATHPIPPPRRQGITSAVRAMEVGDSHEIPSADVGSWLTCAFQLKPAKYKMRVKKGENGKHRIWRIE